MSKGHAPNIKLYMGVFGALLVLTVVTVAVSYLHLPIAAGIMVALIIAGFKASLVAAFFMHLKGEKALIYGVLAVTLFFMGVLFVLPISDTAAIGKDLEPTDVAAQGPAHHAPADGAHAPAEGGH